MKRKEIRFWTVQKSAEEYENKKVNAIKCGALKKSDRKEESFGDEADGMVCEMVAKRGDPETQKYGTK